MYVMDLKKKYGVKNNFLSEYLKIICIFVSN